jgi:solute carrier family 40 (iron-regulated transporter), member 1
MADPRSAELDTFNAPLLADDELGEPADASSHGGIFPNREEITVNEYDLSPAISRRLYLSHFLSTGNSRVFEFGAVLYLASIFPNTLLPISVYALVRGISAVLMAPIAGRYVDTGNRLQVVRVSIVVQRLAVAASCSLFWLLEANAPLNHTFNAVVLCALAFLACLEKLSSILNLVAVERDWVVVVAGENVANLRELNSQMRRIDLFCKLGGPFIISILDGFSTEIAILTNLAMNVSSVVVEYYAIANVYRSVATLQGPKRAKMAASKSLHSCFGDTASQVYQYFRHDAFRASFAGALLYMTVLSFSGQMTTYLLTAGYNSFHIAATRTISVSFEISATWLAPCVMTRIGPVRSGIWFLNWQLLCLAGGITTFWFTKSSIVAASSLVVGTILSRIGLWGFDLSSQVIVQEVCSHSTHFIETRLTLA